MDHLPIRCLAGGTATALAITIAVCAVLQPATGESPGAGTQIQVGVASADITPEPGAPLRLSGYSVRDSPFSGVARRLHAKAIAFSGGGSDGGGGGPVSVLVTLDAIGVPAWLSDELAERLEAEAGVARAHVAVAASHTHCAPALQGVLPFMYQTELSDTERDAIARYTDGLLDRLESVALAAIADRMPAVVSWTKGTVAFAANRRVLSDGAWTGFGVTPDGPVDHSLPLMRVTSADGELRAVLVNYACHCTTLGGGFNEVHGDWAGVARAEIESRHPGATALVAIGCGADQNPHPRSTVELADAHGRSVADEVDRLLTTGTDGFRPLGRAPDAQFREIPLALDPPPDRAVWEERATGDGPGARLAAAVLGRLDRGEPVAPPVSYPVQTWSFGEDLAMLFLGGEVVVDYALRFYREYDPARLWVNAYCNDVPCYIPSERLYGEGGYEVDGSMTYYGHPSRLASGTEATVAAEVARQVPEAFRK